MIDDAAPPRRRQMLDKTMPNFAIRPGDEGDLFAQRRIVLRTSV